MLMTRPAKLALCAFAVLCLPAVSRGEVPGTGKSGQAAYKPPCTPAPEEVPCKDPKEDPDPEGRCHNPTPEHPYGTWTADFNMCRVKGLDRLLESLPDAAVKSLNIETRKRVDELIAGLAELDKNEAAAMKKAAAGLSGAELLRSMYDSEGVLMFQPSAEWGHQYSIPLSYSAGVGGKKPFFSEEVRKRLEARGVYVGDPELTLSLEPSGKFQRLEISDGVIVD